MDSSYYRTPFPSPLGPGGYSPHVTTPRSTVGLGMPGTPRSYTPVTGAPNFGGYYGGASLSGPSAGSLGAAYGASYTSPTHETGYASPEMSLAAADGVIDGRYFGRRILGGEYGPSTGVYPGNSYSSVSRSHLSPEMALDAADGVIDGRYFGRRILGGEYGSSTGFHGPRYTSGSYWGAGPGDMWAHGYPDYHAAMLDAADGVMDGKYFGRRILGGEYEGYGGYRSGYQHFGRPIRGGYMTRAEQLDAADGVMDGKYFGRKIVGDGYGTYEEQLDAADGVMDGKYFGQRIPGLTPLPYYGMTVTDDKKGILKVTNVVPGGPAARGGLRYGDIIHRFCGHPVHTQKELSQLMRQESPGNRTTFDVYRVAPHSIRENRHVFTVKPEAAPVKRKSGGHGSTGGGMTEEEVHHTKVTDHEEHAKGVADEGRYEEEDQAMEF